MPVTAQNALKLSAWLAATHPALFRQILATTTKLQRSPLGRLGFFGDDTLTEFVPDIPDTSVTSSAAMPDMSSFSTSDLSSSFSSMPSAGPGGDLSSMTLSSLDTPAGSGVESSIGYSPAGSSFNTAFDSALGDSGITTAIAQPPASDPSSGGFWSQVASGASSVASSVGKVAAGLLSPQTMTAAAGAAGAYFKAQAQTDQTRAQAQIVNAQLARTAAGFAPAPISYTTNPYTGQVTPVYASNTGYQPVTPGLLNQLTRPTAAGIAGISTPVLLIGGAALLLLAVLAGRGSSTPARP